MINTAHPSNMPMAERGNIQPPQASGANSQSRIEINGNHPIAEELSAMWKQIDRMNRMLFSQHSFSNAAGTVQHIRHTDAFLMREGFLVDDLPRATDSLSGPSYARFRPFFQSGLDLPLGGEQLHIKENDVLWVINRSTTFEAFSGDYLIIAFFNGEWRPLAVPSPGVELVRFKVLDCDCEAGIAEVRVLAVPCNVRLDVEVGDIIEVHDRAGCWLDVARIFVIDSKGYAAHMRNENVVSYYGQYEKCEWEIVSMCQGINSCAPQD